MFKYLIFVIFSVCLACSGDPGSFQEFDTEDTSFVDDSDTSSEGIETSSDEFSTDESEDSDTHIEDSNTFDEDSDTIKVVDTASCNCPEDDYPVSLRRCDGDVVVEVRRTYTCESGQCVVHEIDEPVHPICEFGCGVVGGYGDAYEYPLGSGIFANWAYIDCLCSPPSFDIGSQDFCTIMTYAYWIAEFYCRTSWTFIYCEDNEYCVYPENDPYGTPECVLEK